MLLCCITLWVVDEIADINDRLIGLQQIRDAEKDVYEKQLQQLRTEYKETKDQLIADNMTIGKQISVMFLANFPSVINVNFA